MAFPIEIKGNLVIIATKGREVIQANVIETLKLFIENPSLYAGKKLLIIDEDSTYNPKTEDVREFAQNIKLLFTDIFTRIALVVQKDIHFGLGRMAETFSQAGEHQFSVFRNESEARAWLKK